MEKITHSLQNFRLTKDIKKLLHQINPLLKDEKDLSVIFTKLYQQDLIGEQEFLAIQTKFMLNKFTEIMERNFTDLTCGIYLYEEKEKTLWNGASPSVASAYNEYTNGLVVKDDIVQGDEIPVYVKGSIAIPDLEKGEDLTSLNHKKDLLKSGYKSICLIPLEHNGHTIGHTTMFSKEIRTYTTEEMNAFAEYNKLIEGKLMEIKNLLITTIKNTKAL
jgi:hypothetical protein